MLTKKKNSICFVAHFAYGALAGGESGHIGGVERQTAMMAKWLVKHGYKVSMITWDESQKDGEEIDGVTVHKLCQKDEGIKGLRFIWPRWTSLNAAMKRANADIYYQNCAEYVTGQVALWCRKHNRKFIYSIASEPDCDCTLPKMRKIRERVLYKYGLTHSDKIIVQTKKQYDMLLTGFNINSIIIPMPCNGLPETEYEDLKINRKKVSNILWLGRVCEVKRPDRLLEIAKLNPGIHFDFVGPKDNTGYSEKIIEQAKQIPNVIYHGPAIKEKVWDFYKNSRIFLCTSNFEGFPNTFLEAWSSGLPIVSTVDPDDIITQKNLGIIGSDISQLSSGIRQLLENDKEWENASCASRQYYLENHTLESSMHQFEQVFRKVMDNTD